MDVCLRDLKIKILDSLNDVERGCLNQNSFENFLIELEIQEENSKYHKELSFEDKIEYILTKLRKESKFWVVNSEIYYNIMKKKFFLLDDNYPENKILEATYNYITENEFYYNNDNINIDNNNNIYNFECLHSDNNFVEEKYISIDNTKKYYCDFKIIKLIYDYFTKGKNYSETEKIRIQNFIIFFILNNKLNQNNSFIKFDLTENSYFLRTKDEEFSKLKEEDKELKKQKIQEIFEEIKKIKKEEIVFDFFIISKITRLSFYESEELKNSYLTLYFSYSKRLSESLKNIHLILKVYISVRNVLKLLKKYIEIYLFKEQNSNLYNYRKIKEIDENLLSENEINKICEDYYYSIDNNQYHISKIKGIKKKWKPKNIDIKLIDEACNNYIKNYYERDDIKKLRYYQSKNADWGEDEIKIFEKAQEIFGKEYLANNKIASFMGVNKNHVRYKRLEFTRKFIEKKQNFVKKTLKKIKKKQWKPMN